MRLFEDLLFMLIIVYVMLFSAGVFRKSKGAKYISVIILVSFLLHWFTEGIRWQLFPIYIIVLWLTVTTILNVSAYLNFKRLYTGRINKIIISISMIILILLSIAASYVFPLYNMPKPNGKYNIGTISFDIVNLDTRALFSEGKYENRKIRIQLWYPADSVEGYKNAPWLEDGKIITETISNLIGFPKFLLSPTTLIKSNSYVGAPISTKKSKYPVVIISHGLTGFSSLHADIGEMLASNGYIVAAINHTYAAAVTVFEDGEVEYLNKSALPLGVERKEFLYYANIVLETYSEDIKVTIDTLAKLNSDNSSILFDKLNLSTIGLLGHSAGGGAGVLTALKDNRIKAILGFDPWLDPIKAEDINGGLEVPALFLRSEQWETDPNNKNLYPLLQSSKAYREIYQINGTRHLDFTMIYMYSPLSKTYGYTGKLDGQRASAIRKDFVLTFFNKYLLNIDLSFNVETVADSYIEVEKIEY